MLPPSKGTYVSLKLDNSLLCSLESPSHGASKLIPTSLQLNHATILVNNSKLFLSLGPSHSHKRREKLQKKKKSHKIKNFQLPKQRLGKRQNEMETTVLLMPIQWHDATSAVNFFRLGVGLLPMESNFESSQTATIIHVREQNHSNSSV